MTFALTVATAATSILVLIIVFWRDVANADRTDARKLRRTIVFGIALLVLNIGVEAGKRIAENLSAKESTDEATTNRQIALQLQEDARHLKEEAAEAFKRLEAILASLPSTTAAALLQQAKEVRSAIGPLQKPADRTVDEATLEQTKRSIDATRAGLRNLVKNTEAASPRSGPGRNTTSDGATPGPGGPALARTESDSRVTRQSEASVPSAVQPTDPQFMFLKNCPNIVERYKPTDNITSLVAASAKENARSVSTGSTILSSRPAAKSEARDTVFISTKQTAKQLDWLPLPAEIMIGERLNSEQTNILGRQTSQGRRYYAVADSMLRELLVTVTEPYEYEFKIVILKSSEQNAVGQPGGSVYLDAGLVDDAELRPKAYFALSHELAHILQRHVTKGLQSALVDSASSTQELIRMIRDARTNPSALLSQVRFGEDILPPYNIDQELRADSCASRMLARLRPYQLADSLKSVIRDLPPEAIPPKRLENLRSMYGHAVEIARRSN